MSEAVLKELGIEYERRDDGTLFVPGDIDLLNRALRVLPDLSDVHVGGDFWCQDNHLTSLAGAPLTVGGSFWCNNNYLTTLAGAPQTVGGQFYCCNNHLTSLAGAPQKVEGSFECYDNQLTSLLGAPRMVGGLFGCHENQLTTLKGAPQTVGGGFWCYKNKLTSLEHAPQCFEMMVSDFGEFKKWDDVPEELRLSPATRERLAQEAQEAFNRKMQQGTVTQARVKLLPKIKVPR